MFLKKQAKLLLIILIGVMVVNICKIIVYNILNINNLLLSQN